MSTTKNSYAKILIKMVIQIPLTPSGTTCAVHKCNYQKSSKLQSHTKPSKYTNNKPNCKSKNLIYVLEFMLCNKQYTRKSEITFNLRLSNYQKDVNKQNSLQADQHIQLPVNKFNKHTKFTLIKQLNDTNVDKKLRRHRLKKEDFWIKRFKTLPPHGFNSELNFFNP